MKFIKELVTAGTHIPAAALYLSGLGDSERLELHTLDGAAVLVRCGMTAAQLLATAQSLHTLSMELAIHLARICGPCTGCEEGCPVEWLEGSEVPLPEPREEENSIPPVALLDTLASAGICLGDLRELLSSGDIVYGS